MFTKSKLTNIKDSEEERGGEGGTEKYTFQAPCVLSFSGIAHTQERIQGVPCMSSTRISRSGSWFSPDPLYSHLSEKSTNWEMLPILVNFAN